MRVITLVSQSTTFYNHRLLIRGSSSVNHTAFGAQALRVIGTARGSAPHIIDAGVWGAHDVAVIALDPGIAGMLRNRTRDRVFADVYLECRGLAGASETIRVRVLWSTQAFLFAFQRRQEAARVGAHSTPELHGLHARLPRVLGIGAVGPRDLLSAGAIIRIFTMPAHMRSVGEVAEPCRQSVIVVGHIAVPKSLLAVTHTEMLSLIFAKQSLLFGPGSPGVTLLGGHVATHAPAK